VRKGEGRWSHHGLMIKGEGKDHVQRFSIRRNVRPDGLERDLRGGRRSLQDGEEGKKEEAGSTRRKGKIVFALAERRPSEENKQAPRPEKEEKEEKSDPLENRSSPP